MSFRDSRLAEPTKRGLVLRRHVREEFRYGVQQRTGSLGRQQLGLSSQPLQPHLLLWDRLAASSDANIDQEPDDDEKFLEDCGVLVRQSMEGKTSSVSVEILGQSAEQSRREQIGLFLDLDEREPGCWAIDSQGNEPIPTLFQSPGRSILVKLHQAIPVPDRETPLEDVFRFVERRKPEQIALRSHLDGIYQKIIIAGDGPLAFHTEINNLKMAIADQMAVLNESLFRVTYAGLNAKMKWEFDTRPTVAAATAAGFVAGVEAALAAALIGTISNIIPKIEVEAGAEMLLGARTSRPFEYVLQMHRGW